MLALKRKHLSVFIMLIFQFILSVTFGIAVGFVPRENVIFPGVSINGVNVGGFTASKALKVLNQNFKNKMEKGVLELYCNNQKWKISYSDLGVKYDIAASVKQVLKEQSNLSQVASIAMMKAHVKKPDYPLVYSLDDKKLARVLQSISRSSDREVQNAKIKVSDRNLKVIPSQDGLKVNLSLAEKDLRENIARLNHGPVKLEFSNVKPNVTSGDLSSITDSIGLGISHFSRVDREKYMTIKSAAKVLDGILIPPGEEFSFNSLIGASIKERKYLDSQVSQKEGRLTMVSDNAMSQVASTLYQAVLYSELTVTERFIHSMMPGYVSLGQDAAVGIDKMDFKFKNNGKNPVYILAEVKDNHLLINLLGVKKEGRTVQVITRQGEDTRYPGMVLIKVYRVIYDNGSESKRELISDDKYLSAADWR